MPIILIGTLDTKGTEIAFVRDQIQRAGLDTLVIDAGTLGPAAFKPDTIMPPVKTTPEKYEALVAYLLSLVEVPPATALAGDGGREGPAQ